MKYWMTTLFVSMLAQSSNAFAPIALEKIRSDFLSPRHKLGIKNVPKNWVLRAANPEENLIAKFRSLELPDLVLSIRVDALDRFPSKSPNLKKYVLYYAKKYPRAGLEIVNNPKQSIHKGYAYLVSRVQKQNLQSRQTIVWHPDQKAYIFTCSAKIENYEKATKLCDQMINNVQWQDSLRK